MRFSRIAARKAQLLLFQAAEPAPLVEAEEIDPRPEMLCFRGQTLAIVRHYFELSCQVGRLPSLLGREFFRARVSHHSIPSFEDQVVFTRDIEICLGRLTDDHAEIVTLVGLYDFSVDEVAEMLHRSAFAIRRWFCEALDALAEIFLQGGILSENRPDRRQRQAATSRLPADIAAGARKPPQSVKRSPRARPHRGYGMTLRCILSTARPNRRRLVSWRHTCGARPQKGDNLLRRVPTGNIAEFGVRRPLRRIAVSVVGPCADRRN